MHGPTVLLMNLPTHLLFRRQLTTT